MYLLKITKFTIAQQYSLIEQLTEFYPMKKNNLQMKIIIYFFLVLYFHFLMMKLFVSDNFSCYPENFSNFQTAILIYVTTKTGLLFT